MTPPVHVSDSRLLGHLFSTPAMKAVWSDEATLSRWLKVEAELALELARYGVIPQTAAQAIKQACSPELYDLDQLGAAIQKASHPLTPVISAIELNAGKFAQYVHYSATTQDILDTGTVLQVREALGLILDSLQRLTSACATQAKRWRDLPMPGRTHGQHAVPITLGLKFALWAKQAGLSLSELTAVRDELPVQFAGAAGTLATLGKEAVKVRSALARELGLIDPGASWHTSRQQFASLVSQLAIAAATCGQIAN
jgi:3-carboxy-cis,cis-muconate cycloisomerase